MGKYSPLRAFLEAQERDRVPITFEEIEALLGSKLPNSKRYPAWWSNNASNNPMTKEWLAAGFRTEAVNIEAERLDFRRVPPVRFRGEEQSNLIVAPRGEDPLFGCMAGTLTLLPDYDYTAPAHPEWGKVYDD